jgi:DNA-binding PadR family transcriptional regulator
VTGFREHPYHEEECCGPHGARRSHGHGPAGWGPGAFMFGPHGPHGQHGRSGFGPGGRNRRGMMRYLVLEALAAEPMHGYQIIQHLEERSGGMWRPSPGSVYPTLQLLEDQGLVKSEEVEGRRVYSITDEGRAEAEAGKTSAADSPWAWFAEKAKDPRVKLGQATLQLGDAARQVGMSGTAEQVDKALEVLAEARRKLYQLLADGE